jgi:hypothetical protein
MESFDFRRPLPQPCMFEGENNNNSSQARCFWATKGNGLEQGGFWGLGANNSDFVDVICGVIVGTCREKMLISTIGELFVSSLNVLKIESLYGTIGFQC